MDLVMELSARILVLDAGRPLAIGTPAEIQANPAVVAAYLGSDAADVGGAAQRPRPAARPATTADLLSVRGVVSGYGKVEVLHGVDLDVGAGEFVALVGANGAGKSTLLRTLAGLVAAPAGEVRFDGVALRRAPPDAIVRAGVVMVPEGRQVFPELSVIDNLKLGAYLRRDAEVQADVNALLLRFPQLSERSAQRAGLLSGGEQQMLALARGLVARPKLLLLDEPSLGLAPKLVAELYQIVTQLRDEGKTLLLVDQFARLALALADRAYVMATGRIVKHGQAADLLADPAVEAAYLGKA
jgi:ABC-type branched-subunit amino acid transport system ATPase component